MLDIWVLFCYFKIVLLSSQGCFTLVTTGDLFIVLEPLVSSCSCIFKASAINPLYSNTLHHHSSVIDRSLYTEKLLVIATYYLQKYIKIIILLHNCIMLAKTNKLHNSRLIVRQLLL